MTDGLDLQWRPMRDDDRNYVLSSWLRSYARSDEFRRIVLDVYFELYQPMVRAMLERSTVAICWAQDMPDSILGWMAVEGDDVLHYLVVKPHFRKLGIATWMLRDLRAMRAIYTHQPTRLAAMRLVGGTWTYDPRRRIERKAAA